MSKTNHGRKQHRPASNRGVSRGPSQKKTPQASTLKDFANPTDRYLDRHRKWVTKSQRSSFYISDRSRATVDHDLDHGPTVVDHDLDQHHDLHLDNDQDNDLHHDLDLDNDLNLDEDLDTI